VIECARCGHANAAESNFCSSCGAPLSALEETTLTLSAVAAEQEEDDLAEYIEGLAAGTGLLVVRHGPNAGSTYLLDSDVTSVGRHPDSDIFLDDITVSRRHVLIERHGGAFELRDVGSLNGTYVNRRRCDRAVLRHRDEIQVGRYRLVFVEGGHERANE
jgi:pSer/pThr/pTyr-binding forkhead associated (FHA) protein